MIKIHTQQQIAKSEIKKKISESVQRKMGIILTGIRNKTLFMSTKLALSFLAAKVKKKKTEEAYIYLRA